MGLGCKREDDEGEGVDDRERVNNDNNDILVRASKGVKEECNRLSRVLSLRAVGSVRVWRYDSWL